MTRSAPQSRRMAGSVVPAKQRASLFDQQLWYWGRDAAHPDGNLLVEYGFARTGRPVGRNCASLYQFQPRIGARIVLRGFGVFIGDDRLGGVFLYRKTTEALLAPCATLAAPPWEPAELPPLHPPKSESEQRVCQDLLGEMCEWIVAYEKWAMQRCGNAYRLQATEAWRQVVKARCIAYRYVRGGWRDWGRDLLTMEVPDAA